MKETGKFVLLVLGFLAFYYVPFDHSTIRNAGLEAFLMVQEYAQKHILTCLVPAFFIAGAISCFVSQAAVMKYFGAQAKKVLSYSVASVSGTILAVCSCTVLPIFAGIYQQGAGIGPATAFLYSGPAINVLAIILTAKVLGWKLGLARAIGAILFSVVIGLVMATIYRKEEREKVKGQIILPEEETKGRPLWKEVVYIMTLVLILIFAAWARPEEDVGFWMEIYQIHWYIAIGLLAILALILLAWFRRDELVAWGESTWSFAKQILPLLFIGVLVAGFFLGRPESNHGIIPSNYIAYLVGGNSLVANLFASISAALMYFATLTEVPILQGLIGNGMGQGPALALLLAGPALSLPSMLVIRSVIGTKKTLVYISLVVVMATISGMIYGIIVK
ncbi:MAG: permease [Pseudomonadota bacterium]